MSEQKTPSAVASGCACTTLRKATRAVGRAYDEALAPAGMTTAQFALLRNLSRSGPLALSRLAEEQVMDRTSLYRALAPIEAKGWITIEAGRGRAKLAALTEAGRDAMAGAEPYWEAAQAAIIGGMGTMWDEFQTALRALTSIAKDAR